MTAFSGQTAGPLNRLGKSTFHVKATITCAPAAVAPGTYPLTVEATVFHDYSLGQEQDFSNNSASTTASSRYANNCTYGVSDPTMGVLCGLIVDWVTQEVVIVVAYLIVGRGT